MVDLVIHQNHVFNMVKTPFYKTVIFAAKSISQILQASVNTNTNTIQLD